VTVGDRKAIQKRLNRAHRQFYPRAPESLATAAKYFKLDPDDVRQREELLYKLADVVFGSAKRGRRPGSKTAWGTVRLVSLGGLYFEKKYENPGLSDADAARLISNHHEFKHDDPDQIRQRLPWAREVYSEAAFEADNDAAHDYMTEHPDEFEDSDEQELDYYPDF
jgi:hypothetical protein